MRFLDRFALHSVTIPGVILICLYTVSSKAQPISPSQGEINATTAEWRIDTNRRLSHLETVADGEFLAILGLLLSQVVSIKSQKNRRIEERKHRHVTED